LIQEYEKNKTLNYFVDDIFSSMAVPALTLIPFAYMYPTQIQGSIRLLTFNLIFKLYYSALKTTASSEILDIFFPYETLFVKGKIWNILWSTIIAVFVYFGS
jgi:hypothetical protein